MNRNRIAVVLGPGVGGEEKVGAIVNAIFEATATATGEAHNEGKMPNEQKPLPGHLEPEKEKLNTAWI
jgi:hypothetical protein